MKQIRTAKKIPLSVNNMREARKRLPGKVTQQLLAERANLSLKSIQKYEGSDEEIIGVRRNTFEALRKVLGLSEGELSGNRALEKQELVDLKIAKKQNVQLQLVAQHYNCEVQEILAFIPLLFTLSAEAALKAHARRPSFFDSIAEENIGELNFLDYHSNLERISRQRAVLRRPTDEGEISEDSALLYWIKNQIKELDNPSVVSIGADEIFRYIPVDEAHDDVPWSLSLMDCELEALAGNDSLARRALQELNFGPDDIPSELRTGDHTFERIAYLRKLLAEEESKLTSEGDRHAE